MEKNPFFFSVFFYSYHCVRIRVMNDKKMKPPWKKIYLALVMCRKQTKKEFLKSHDSLLSHHLNSTGQSINQGFFGGSLLALRIYFGFLHICRAKYIFPERFLFFTFIPHILTQSNHSAGLRRI